MKRSLLLASCLFLLSSSALADEEPKFKVVPSGRVLIDGAVYFSHSKEKFKDGMAISEARLGAKMDYGKWTSWIDVGFAYGKIGLRNMWIEYSPNEHHHIRIGNYLQNYGLQANVSSSLKETFEQPLASALFTPGMHLGAAYTFYNHHIYSSSGFHVESNALTNVMNYPDFNKQGFTILSRFVWRNAKIEDNKSSVVHAGISLGFSTPQARIHEGYDVHDGFSNTANFPTKVSNVEALGVVVGNSSSLFKFTPELLLSKGKVALSAQYFFQEINRKGDLPAFISQGGYITLRGMLLGGNYSYDYGLAQLGYPKKQALECVFDYNYATLCDYKAGIFGGRANNFTFTLNYYINKYITARLNYSYTHVWGREDHEPVTQNVVQARIMVLF